MRLHTRATGCAPVLETAFGCVSAAQTSSPRGVPEGRSAGVVSRHHARRVVLDAAPIIAKPIAGYLAVALAVRCSAAAPNRSTVSSSRCLPTICIPTGRESRVIPAGTLIAGCPVRFAG